MPSDRRSSVGSGAAQSPARFLTRTGTTDCSSRNDTPSGFAYVVSNSVRAPTTSTRSPVSAARSSARRSSPAAFGAAWAGPAWAGPAWAGPAWAGPAWAGPAWAGPAWAGAAIAVGIPTPSRAPVKTAVMVLLRHGILPRTDTATPNEKRAHAPSEGMVSVTTWARQRVSEQ
ncbi:hypothetical protein ACFYT4_18095 [Streptomyces sp. NPDC004609]|uniref:hypothetical protein n=1 Tax=Streptomyces sp. NPDC004609 TaxID=3364704 RepID=UPI003679D9DA